MPSTCMCPSIRPGIRVWPLPSMIVVEGGKGVEKGSMEVIVPVVEEKRTVVFGWVV